MNVHSAIRCFLLVNRRRSSVMRCCSATHNPHNGRAVYHDVLLKPYSDVHKVVLSVVLLGRYFRQQVVFGQLCWLSAVMLQTDYYCSCHVCLSGKYIFICLIDI